MRAVDDSRPVAPPERLDAWLGEPAVRTHHHRAAALGPEALWRAANAVRLSDTRTLGRLVRWRIPGLARDLTYGELFRAYPFTILEEGERHLISGLCGRIWTLARDYPRLGGPEEFARWDARGTVRVLFGHWVQESEGGAVLVSEARVKPTDRAAGLRLRALWALIGPFERLVGDEAIATAANASARSPRG
jgi:hypothetical protein